jgi:hypothetical protein
MRLANPPPAPVRRGMRDMQVAPMPFEGKDSRNLASCASTAEGALLTRDSGHRQELREPAAAPSAAAPQCGLEFMFGTQVEVRFGLVRQRSCGARSLADRSRLAGSEFPIRSIHRQLGPSPSSIADAARKRRRAGPYEIYKWPTKCSSTRRTRRKPGWSSCAAIASKNSTLNPLLVSSSGATFI